LTKPDGLLSLKLSFAVKLSFFTRRASENTRMQNPYLKEQYYGLRFWEGDGIL
jgi:hypothetical protein